MRNAFLMFLLVSVLSGCSNFFSPRQAVNIVIRDLTMATQVVKLQNYMFENKYTTGLLIYDPQTYDVSEAFVGSSSHAIFEQQSDFIFSNHTQDKVCGVFYRADVPASPRLIPCEEFRHNENRISEIEDRVLSLELRVRSLEARMQSAERQISSNSARISQNSERITELSDAIQRNSETINSTLRMSTTNSIVSDANSRFFESVEAQVTALRVEIEQIIQRDAAYQQRVTRDLNTLNVQLDRALRALEQIR
ncbi:MAG: hypothetical protein ABJF86_12210 [Tateyamaria sp.]|uniref:hypothetical protein n=1 Tax=Tateyamaria sp. TaxID=1929288 RepID=UPI003293B53A